MKMTKQELINELNDIGTKVDDALSTVSVLEDELKRVQTRLENLPAEPDEIDDDEDGEEDEEEDDIPDDPSGEVEESSSK